jgi:hypothetical protein
MVIIQWWLSWLLLSQTITQLNYYKLFVFVSLYSGYFNNNNGGYICITFTSYITQLIKSCLFSWPQSPVTSVRSLLTNKSLRGD